MKIVYLANNRLGFQILQYLQTQSITLLGLGLHPESKRSYGHEFLNLVKESDTQILPGAKINTPPIITMLKALAPDLILSVLFGYKLSPEVLAIPSQGSINLHPSYLPYNRGAYPNVWSIIEGTPAGTTLHYMDAEFDTGAIIAQNEVPISMTDTGQTLYKKLEQAAYDLFCQTWPQIASGQITPKSQNTSEGTYHITRDVEKIDTIDLDQTYTARELINILRARTFPPHRGAYIEDQGKRIYLNLELIEDDKPDA